MVASRRSWAEAAALLTPPGRTAASFAASGAPGPQISTLRNVRCVACDAPLPARTRGRIPRYCPEHRIAVAAAWAVRSAIAPVRAAGRDDIVQRLEQLAADLEPSGARTRAEPS